MKKKYTILVLNGPNLRHLGERQPELYGELGMEALPERLEALSARAFADIKLLFAQHNGEGALIDALEKARLDKVDGVVLNAGAYSHTSLALGDCLAWVGLPYVEVHLSNVLAREQERQKSFTARHALGVVSGFGLVSYALGLLALHTHLENKSED